MNKTRILKLMNEYIPTSRKEVGRPRTRWMNQHLWKSEKVYIVYAPWLMMVVVVVMEGRKPQWPNF